MSTRRDGSTAAAARAVERVLRAERDAEAGVERARADAADVVAAARDEALATVNGAIERIGRWQQRHAAAVRLRLAARRAAATASVRTAPDAQRLADAAARVAARLTGGSDP